MTRKDLEARVAQLEAQNAALLKTVGDLSAALAKPATVLPPLGPAPTVKGPIWQVPSYPIVTCGPFQYQTTGAAANPFYETTVLTIAGAPGDQCGCWNH